MYGLTITGFFMWCNASNKATMQKVEAYRAKRQSYPLLSPRIFIDNPNDVIINFTNLRSQLRNYFRQVQEPLGMYFEYLPSGMSIGINENQEFLQASLIKVPLAMAVYKKIEKGELKEDTLVTILPSDLNREFGELYKSGVNKQLTINELVEIMLSQSDNTAAAAIGRQLNDNDVFEVFDALDIPFLVKDDQPVVSPKNYSSILKTLYLSAYLNYSHSQKILHFLSKSTFNDKIAYPIAPHITVAHKIGVVGKGNEQIYTDCGIVYVPQRPYTLCIMGKGKEAAITRHMQQLSGIIYQYVSAQNK